MCELLVGKYAELDGFFFKSLNVPKCAYGAWPVPGLCLLITAIELRMLCSF